MTPDHDLWLRIIGGGALLLSLTVSGYFRRRARLESGTIERRAEGWPLLALRLAIALPLFGMIVLYLIHPPAMAWAAVPLPATLRWLGAGLLLLAAPLVIWVFTNLGRNVSETVLVKSDHQLVTSGPYRWVRHPLYTTGLLLLTGMSLLAANAALALGTVAVAVLIVRVVIPREEAALIATFGDAYRAYRRRTGRLWPSWSANRTIDRTPVG